MTENSWNFHTVDLLSCIIRWSFSFLFFVISVDEHTQTKYSIHNAKRCWQSHRSKHTFFKNLNVELNVRSHFFSGGSKTHTQLFKSRNMLISGLQRTLITPVTNLKVRIFLRKNQKVHRNRIEYLFRQEVCPLQMSSDGRIQILMFEYIHLLVNPIDNIYGLHHFW